MATTKKDILQNVANGTYDVFEENPDYRKTILAAFRQAGITLEDAREAIATEEFLGKDPTQYRERIKRGVKLTDILTPAKSDSGFGPYVRVTFNDKKGTFSVTGLQKTFPITHYGNQWLRFMTELYPALFDKMDQHKEEIPWGKDLKAGEGIPENQMQLAKEVKEFIKNRGPELGVELNEA